MPTEVFKPALLFRVQQHRCALPTSSVVETLRPLPVQAIRDQPVAMLGLSIVRGEPVPVIDTARLIGEKSSQPTDTARFLLLRAGGRQTVLLVDEVLGVRDLTSAKWVELPPVLRETAGEALLEVGRLDRELLLVLRAARFVQDDVWQMAERRASE